MKTNASYSAVRLGDFWHRSVASIYSTRKMKTARGFTLLEMLIALFIFTIISLLLVRALHHVINADARTERVAKRLREMQMGLLILSRDIEQAVNRPVMNAQGKEEAAFIGEAQRFTFTHTGFADLIGGEQRSALSRTEYRWQGTTLWRRSTGALDGYSVTTMHARALLSQVTAAHFEYLDETGHFHDVWPVAELKEQPLPRAVRVKVTLLSFGEMSQLYVISTQNNQTNVPPSLQK